MKKPTIVISLGFILMLVHLTGWAEIIIKQDKNGNKIITNHAYSYDSLIRKKTPKKSSKSSVPQVYLNKIRILSRKYNVREKLIIAVVKMESDFNPRAVSRKGAVGLMQLMKATAGDYGVTDRFDPDQNLDAGVRHLKYLHKKYNSNIPLTLAAYNAGVEAVTKYKGVPPYKETRTYIRRVMSFMGLSYSSYARTGSKARIYKYVTKDGRVIITDTLPSKIDGTVTVLD